MRSRPDRAVLLQLASLTLAFAVFATACTADTATTATIDAVDNGAGADDEPPSERTIFAGVNIAIADVPLSAVVFDTFDGGSVPLSEATEQQVDELLNAIRPLNQPEYLDGVDADWLTPDDIVLGYIADDGTAWAHPHRVMNFHEIINIDLAGRPVVITYCPLCGAGVVFDRRPQDLRHDGALTFDNTSALYENDMVMVDQETKTYWWHLAGRGIVGNLTGAELTVLPSTTTTWRTWLETHPDTQVLSNDQGRGPSYAGDPFVDYATRVDAGIVPFPIGPEAFDDGRLAPSTRVIGFRVDGDFVAVPVLANEPTVVPTVGGHVVLLDGQGGGNVFVTDSDLGPAGTSGFGAFVDPDGTRYDIAGRPEPGTDAALLESAPSSTAFWFAWISATDGDTRLFTPDGEVTEGS